MELNRKHILLILTVIALIIVMLVMLTKRGSNEFSLKNSVPVYFLKTYGENDYKLIAVRRKIYKDEANLKVAIIELLKGPNVNEQNLGYYSEIPPKTQLIEIKNTPERVTINLSQEFGYGGGSSAMTMRLKQLAHTALSSVDKKPVYLELDGEQANVIGGEGVMVPQPLSVNLNKGQDI